MLKDHLLQPQPRLGGAGLLVLLVVSSVITPLSLDMYTPAVPHMADYFATDVGLVNMTLLGYYVFFALGMLVFGPLSDAHGRRPVLLAGIAAYAVGSIGCALSPSIWALIAFRIVQALGAGSISAVGMAIVKDSFEVVFREKVLSAIQVLFVVGPAAAPVIGAGVVTLADWRMTFWILSAVGIGCFLLTLGLRETLSPDMRTQGSVGHALGQLVVVGRNPGFMAFLIVGSLFEVPFMGYIAVGSYIYIDFFDVGEVGYSLFFAAAAVVMAAGPLIWLVASKRVSVRRFTTLLFAAACLVGAATATVGTMSPFAFCACFTAFALMESCARPYTMNILLEQQSRDTGAASALMNCIRTGIGAVGMGIAALPWPNYAMGVGVLMVVFMGAACSGWVALLHSRIPLVRVKGSEPVRAL